MFKIYYPVLLSLLLFLICFPIVEASVTVSNQAATTPIRLSSSPDGQAVTTQDYIFWSDKSGALYGYNLNKHTTFTVSSQSGRKSQLASDGRTLVWVQGPPGTGQAIKGYDVTTNREYEIISSSAGREFGNLAFTENVLYYREGTPGHTGLYSIDLAAKQEQLVSLSGQKPAGAGGAVVWQEENYRGELLPDEWSLNLLKPGSNQSKIELARAAGEFDVSVSGENVIWAALPPAADQQVYLYNFNDGKVKAISSQAGRKPVIAGNRAGWVVPPHGDKTNLWSVQLLDLISNKLSTLVAPGTVKIDLVGLTGAGGTQAVFTVYGANPGVTTELYMAGVDEQNLSFTAASAPTMNVITPAASPLTCGQVYRQGYFLNDCNGRWPVNGVQFILPGFGINGQTFWDNNYNSSVAGGQVDYWLDKASSFLGAKNLRIFVDLPSDVLPGPTGPATLYSFALKANNLGMRLGVVLHNDTSWTLTSARKQWLSNLISYFRDRNALSLLSYLSADNEINNHCGTGPDCYDNNSSYVDKANRWVADFSAYVKSLNPSLLITVGITTEKADADGKSSLYDFYRTGGTAPNLASSVDFLSPHNYAGGGYSIWPALRYDLGYQGPIVLEEYGYPTDPSGANSHYKEGDPTCRSDPYISICYQTAPYFIEVNTRSMRENTVNGFAGGSAWMLADSNTKDCASPFDFYTGLFASGGYTQCGGTVTTTTGQPKSTAARIRFDYLGSIDFPPKAPSGLAIQSVVTGQVNLSWVDNSANELNFRIERKTGASGNWAEIATVGPNITSFQDSGLLGGITYYYRVRSYIDNGTDSYSAYSNEAAASIPFPVPTGLSTAAASFIQINLGWTDLSSGESGYRIERHSPTTNWIEIATTGPNTTSYQDIGLEPGINYTYRIRASYSQTNSGYSNEASATTPATADYMVTNPDANAVGGTDSLSYALSHATSGQSILVAPGGNTVTVGSSLPPLQGGVTLAGYCDTNGPSIVIKGTPGQNGLTLAGMNTTIYGLEISGFLGSQLKAQAGGNSIKCVKTRY